MVQKRGGVFNKMKETKEKLVELVIEDLRVNQHDSDRFVWNLAERELWRWTKKELKKFITPE